MYNAPAVVFPVARSWVQGQILVLLWITGCVAVGYWLALFNHPAWSMAVVAVLLLTTGLGAARYWWQSWGGTLRWDRQNWAFSPLQPNSSDAQTLSDVSVLLDFQAVLLVRFEMSSGKRVTFWLDQSAARAQWLSLRRAIYARPRAINKKHLTKQPVQREGTA